MGRTLAYQRWASCERKRVYDSEDEALEAARWASTDKSTPHPYVCDYCDEWHIGRELRTKNQKRKRNRLLRRPHHKSVANRLDPTLLAEIGERALVCGRVESVGSKEKRFHALAERFAAAERKRER